MTALNKQALREKIKSKREFFDTQTIIDVDVLEALLDENARLTAERNALRETMGGDNTRAAADIYFQLAEECDIPPGGSLVGYVDDIKERLSNAEKRIAELEARKVTVKLPADYRNSDGSINDDMFNTCAVVGAFRDALAAAGIGVKGE